MDKVRDLGDSASAKLHATSCFAGWQRQMESLLIQAGKRNIVNTYVWDANGGLHRPAELLFNGGTQHRQAPLASMPASTSPTSSVFGAAFDLTALHQPQHDADGGARRSPKPARSQLNVDLSRASVFRHHRRIGASHPAQVRKSVAIAL